jgi:hypothetical protein
VRKLNLLGLVVVACLWAIGTTSAAASPDAPIAVLLVHISGGEFVGAVNPDDQMHFYSYERLSGRVTSVLLGTFGHSRFQMNYVTHAGLRTPVDLYVVARTGPDGGYETLAWGFTEDGFCIDKQTAVENEITDVVARMRATIPCRLKGGSY